MSKHTPGPLAVIQAGSDRDDSRIVARVGNKEIANLGIYNDPSEEESDANARLFAAAPELLQACADLLNIVRVQNGNLREDINALQDAARAAIKKATIGVSA